MVNSGFYDRFYKLQWKKETFSCLHLTILDFSSLTSNCTISDDDSLLHVLVEVLWLS